ncbi:XrtA/PEP-CTERM system histidine kinase PrsK [Pseudorhodoferax sp. Leaf267]|uniref:XrtA/PEP-CTERM system histidine kinase PrsK n=1 Tax=Pseudorhodoferax sp. Leaf267 TaxID=1736316 RepID=UPI0006FC1D54|nr:XrtA/PEP-CTERM system histidine kinase PrsK [Pseudorhodoferax sp. Leaf267]KQP17953.1 histidine kinase [Pseudorhodoferax sp. Leaf267]
MEHPNFLLTVWGYALAGLAFVLFAVVLVRRRALWVADEGSSPLMLGAVVSSAAWAWLGLAGLFNPSTSVLQLAASLADWLRYACWIGVLLLLWRPRTGQPLLRRLGSTGWVAVGLVGGSLVAQLLNFFDPRWAEATGPWVLLGAMAMPVLALFLLEQVYRNVAEDARWSIKPLCLGLAGSFLFDLYLFSQAVLFSRLDLDAMSVRGLAHALLVPLLWWSVTGRGDWITKVRVSRTAAFHSATLLLAGIYLIFISAVGYYVRYFGGDWGRALQVGLVFLASVGLMILAMSGVMRSRLRVMVGKHFFRYRYDYREEWLRFTQTLSDRQSTQGMGQRVIRGLADMLESPAGCLWVREPGESDLRCAATWNMPSTEDKEAADSAFCRFLSDSGWVINLEEYRSFPQRYGDLVLPAWLHEVRQAWLVVPLTVGDGLTGFVVLASARAEVDVNWEVNDLLKTAGRQAASFLAQMQATEALLEVRKFDAFNKMSAFVVHDLKNIVTQLSLMMKNAKRLHGNPEFQQDMLMTVENSLDRMRQLMLQLREGATPTGTVHGVDLAAIAQRIARVAEGRDRHLQLQLTEHVVARGHEERLERIIGHMVQNAFDATDAPGRVWLTLGRSAGMALVEVGDTGRGMSKDFVRDRLFKPFQTTKQAGMGIGAYESFQYVQELGGKIVVDSELGKGTVIKILLPPFGVHKTSDLHAVEN